SARAAALSQGVLQAMFLTKLKTVALALFVVGVLGSGAGLLTHQALADKTETTQTAKGKQPASRAEDGVPPNRDTRGRADEENPVVAEEYKAPAAQDKGGKAFRQQVSGTVVRVDRDGQGLGLEIHSKVEGGASRKVEITITDKTQLLFSNVGPNEARLTEGYVADVWLEEDSKDVAARVYLRGHRNTKSAPHRVGQVVAVTAG